VSLDKWQKLDLGAWKEPIVFSSKIWSICLIYWAYNKVIHIKKNYMIVVYTIGYIQVFFLIFFENFKFAIFVLKYAGSRVPGS
jgi:hypothetical protein